MAKKVMGTELMMRVPGIQKDAFDKLMNLAKNARADFHGMERTDGATYKNLSYQYGVEGNLGEGSIQIVTDMAKESEAIGKLLNQLNTVYGVGNVFQARDKQVRLNQSHIKHSPSTSSIKAMAVNHAMDAHIDKSSNTLTTMIADDRDDLRRRVAGYIGQGRQKDREGKEIRQSGSAAFEGRVWREIDALEERRKARESYVKQFPKSPLARRLRKEKRDIRNAKVRRGVAGAARIVQAWIRTTVNNIASVLVASLGMLTKLHSAVMDVGETVRRRDNTDRALNFEPGTVAAWERLAVTKKWDGNALAGAASGLYGSFGNVTNFAKTNLEPWSFLLGSGVANLATMITPEGNTDIAEFMRTLMNMVVDNISSGFGGVERPNVGFDEAYKEQYQRLHSLNPQLATLLRYYDEEFRLAQQKNPALQTYQDWKITDKDGIGHSMSDWREFMRYGLWNSLVANGLQTPDVGAKTGAVLTAYDALRNFSGTFLNLKEDALSAIAINTLNIVEQLRGIVVSWLAPFFPAFAAREAERASIINIESDKALRAIMPLQQQRALDTARDLGYEGDIEELAGAVHESTEKLSFEPIIKLGLPIEVLTGVIQNLDPLAAYGASLKARRRLDKELSEDTFAQKAVHVTPSLMAEQTKMAVEILRVAGGYRFKLGGKDENPYPVWQVDRYNNYEEQRKENKAALYKLWAEEVREANRTGQAQKDRDVDTINPFNNALGYGYGGGYIAVLRNKSTRSSNADFVTQFEDTFDIAMRVIGNKKVREQGIQRGNMLTTYGKEAFESLLLPALDIMVNSEKFKNLELKGKDLVDIVNSTGTAIKVLQQQGLNDEAGRIWNDYYMPMLTKLVEDAPAGFSWNEHKEALNIPFINADTSWRVQQLLQWGDDPKNALRYINTRLYRQEAGDVIARLSLGGKPLDSETEAAINDMLAKLGIVFADHAAIDSSGQFTEGAQFSLEHGDKFGDLIVNISLGGKTTQARIHGISGVPVKTNKFFDVQMFSSAIDIIPNPLND